MRARKAIVAATALLASIGAANATPELGLDFTGTPTVFGSSEWNLGYAFTANSNITVAALGNMDFGALTSLSQPQQVGLWDSSGNLLASAFVGAGSMQVGEWAFTSITPVLLTAGQTYLVGGQGGASYAGELPVSVDPNITYVGSRFFFIGNTSNSPLVEPIDSDGFNSPSDAGWFGGNIELASASVGAVPEPITLSLFGAGLAGAVAMRRRRKTKG
jgi:hypothetical protein